MRQIGKPELMLGRWVAFVSYFRGRESQVTDREMKRTEKTFDKLSVTARILKAYQDLLSVLHRA